MRRLLLALCLLAPCAAGCKHSSSSSSSSHTETSTVTDSTSSETGTQTTVTTTSEAPGKVTTTVEDYAPPEGGDSTEPSSGSSGANDAGVPATQGVVSRPSHGPLVRRTVTVTEHGAETSETHQQATSQAQGATETKRNTEGDTKTKGKSASGPSAGCIGSSWMIGLGILLFAAALILGILRFRRAA